MFYSLGPEEKRCPQKEKKREHKKEKKKKGLIGVGALYLSQLESEGSQEKGRRKRVFESFASHSSIIIVCASFLFHHFYHLRPFDYFF